MFRLSTGTWSPDPEGRPKAAVLGKRRYATPKMCPTCKTCQTRITASGRCTACMLIITDMVRHFLTIDETSESITIQPEIFNNQTPTWDAKEAFLLLKDSDEFTLHAQPCKQYAHVRITSDKHHKCYFCETNSNAQEQADKEGNDKYVTRSKCGGCGDTALRHTSDSSCTECGYLPKRATGSKSEIAQFMEDNADMELSKEDAELVDMKIYRTGKPCSKGHTGWRYVSTGNCIDCIRSTK